MNHLEVNNLLDAEALPLPYAIYSLTYNATTPQGAITVLNNNLEELVHLHAGLLINKQSKHGAKL